MNWASAKFDWNQVRAFFATVEEGSLSAAARALGQSQPTVGRQVAALEEDLGVTLFERVGRNLELTSAGVELLDHVRAMGDAADRISLVASGQSQSVEGHVTITASDVISVYLLPKMIRKLQEFAPGITVEIMARNDVQNLQRREADIAIRHLRPDQPELYARLLGEATARFCAAPNLIAARGRPESLEDLAKLPFVGFGDDARFIEELGKFGLHLSPENFRTTSENGVVALELVRQGLGVCVMETGIARQMPDIEVLLPDTDPIRFPVWLAVHRELKTARRIRIVYDFLAEELGKALIG